MQTGIDQIRRLAVTAFISIAFVTLAAPVSASDFSRPWLRSDRALVLDAYEYNPLDWEALASNRRLAGFINKGSDGFPPPYHCSGNETEISLCKALWKRYAVARELYHTRRSLAKSLGLKWGVYHLGRPGDPVEQANHLIDYAEPDEDDLIAIDIEGNDPEKWMSLNDAEIFARHIKTRLGRYPLLYTNGSTAKFIADNRLRFPLLARLPLWYARYKPEIGMHFPKGNWKNYALWQFASNVNCSKRKCPLRLNGTPLNIDINVAAMSAEHLRKAWPFGGLLEPVPVSDEDARKTSTAIARRYRPRVKIPLPVPRNAALSGDYSMKMAIVTGHVSLIRMARAYGKAQHRYRDPSENPSRQVFKPASETAKALAGTDNRAYARTSVSIIREARILSPAIPNYRITMNYSLLGFRSKLQEMKTAQIYSGSGRQVAGNDLPDLGGALQQLGSDIPIDGVKTSSTR